MDRLRCHTWKTWGSRLFIAGTSRSPVFFQFIREVFPALQLKNLQILIETPDQAFAEYEFEATSTKTGRLTHQLLFGRLVAEGGKIKLLGESLNTAAAVLAIFPDGLAGLPAGARLSNPPKGGRRQGHNSSPRACFLPPNVRWPPAGISACAIPRRCQTPGKQQFSLFTIGPMIAIVRWNCSGRIGSLNAS